MRHPAVARTSCWTTRWFSLQKGCRSGSSRNFAYRPSARLQHCSTWQYKQKCLRNKPSHSDRNGNLAAVTVRHSHFSRGCSNSNELDGCSTSQTAPLSITTSRSKANLTHGSMFLLAPACKPHDHSKGTLLLSRHLTKPGHPPGSCEVTASYPWYMQPSSWILFSSAASRP